MSNRNALDGFSRAGLYSGAHDSRSNSECLVFLNKNIVQDLRQLRLKLFERKCTQHAIPPSRTHFFGAYRIREQRFKRTGKPFDIAMRHKPACYSILDHIE